MSQNQRSAVNTWNMGTTERHSDSGSIKPDDNAENYNGHIAVEEVYSARISHPSHPDPESSKFDSNGAYNSMNAPDQVLQMSQNQDEEAIVMYSQSQNDVNKVSNSNIKWEEFDHLDYMTKQNDQEHNPDLKGSMHLSELVHNSAIKGLPVRYIRQSIEYHTRVPNHRILKQINIRKSSSDELGYSSEPHGEHHRSGFEE